MTDTPTALSPEELAAKLDALDDETMCFDGEATYALIRDAAHVIRAQKLHTDRVDAKLVEQARQIEALTAENEQLEATFDLRYKADARAIKQWQEVTGKTMSMPDQADLCVFLMMALDIAQRDLATLRTVTSIADSADKARATTAEAALSASLERERGMREALEKSASVFGLLHALLSEGRFDEYEGMAKEAAGGEEMCRAALAAKETTDGR